MRLTGHKSHVDEQYGIFARDLNKGDRVLRVALDEVGPPFKVETQNLGLELGYCDVRGLHSLDVETFYARRLGSIGVEIVNTRGVL